MLQDERLHRGHTVVVDRHNSTFFAWLSRYCNDGSCTNGVRRSHNLFRT